MKDVLRTRFEYLWAKLAGRDVDIDTVSPDAPTSMIEKLMLETADRIANAEGGGNPNTVQTITGTVGDPFGEIDSQKLYDALKDGRNPIDVNCLFRTTELSIVSAQE